MNYMAIHPYMRIDYVLACIVSNEWHYYVSMDLDRIQDWDEFFASSFLGHFLSHQWMDVDDDKLAPSIGQGVSKPAAAAGSGAVMASCRSQQAAPHLRHSGGGDGEMTEPTMVARQEGQLAWAVSQVSMQAPWKPWAQRGSTRSWSPSANAARQMAHSLSSSLVLPFSLFREEETETVGSASMAAFSSPLGGWADDLPPELLPPPLATSDTEAPPLRQAHRATSARPATQMRAQRRDARMTTVSESTEMACCCCCSSA